METHTTIIEFTLIQLIKFLITYEYGANSFQERPEVTYSSVIQPELSKLKIFLRVQSDVPFCQGVISEEGL